MAGSKEDLFYPYHECSNCDDIEHREDGTAHYILQPVIVDIVLHGRVPAELRNEVTRMAQEDHHYTRRRRNSGKKWKLKVVSVNHNNQPQYFALLSSVYVHFYSWVLNFLHSK
jgi:hypothetical protein